MYFDQLVLAARKAHVVYSDQLLGAALCMHFISNSNSRGTISGLSFLTFWDSCFGAMTQPEKSFNKKFAK